MPKRILVLRKSLTRELIMPEYNVYLIKKTAKLVIIDADNVPDAEQKAWELLSKETFENDAIDDWDRYVYCEGEK